MSLATLLVSRVARIALLAPALARMKRNAVRAAIGIGLVAVLGGLGLAYLLIALRTQLEREIGPLWAPLAIGGVLVVAALAAYVTLLRPRRQRAASAEAIGLPPEIGASMRTLETKVSKNPLPSIAVAIAAGFAAAAVLRLLRQRGAAPGPAPHARTGAAAPGGARPEPPPWTREVLLRETERRKGNGRAP